MSSQGKSRLDKLLHLLENGSSMATRQEAGRQIAEIAKASPAQLPTLQRKLCNFLGSGVWETRVAAGDTLGRMAEHFKQPSVSDLRKVASGSVKSEAAREAAAGTESAADSEKSSGQEAGSGAFAFETFNMQRVLEKGTPLLGSGGQEYDQWQAELSAATPEERLHHERKNLKNRLGLGDGMTSFMDTKDLFDDEDLMTSSSAPEKTSTQEAAQLVDEMAGGLSARERNRLKRKARKDGSFKRGAASQDQGAGPSDPSLPQSEEAVAATEAQLVEEDIQEWREVCAGRWIFQRTLDRMSEAVLHPTWQVRHGAAMALREVLRSQAGCAGVSTTAAGLITDGAAFVKATDLRPGMQSAQGLQEAERANSAWLQDCIIRVMCVLALDRFGDYVSDQVVAPVRETAAQALGAAVQGLPMDSLKVVMELLSQLKDRQEWQVRHSCVLGWKYVLAARKELADELLPEALPPLIQGLNDKDDDVRAAAAEALVPVTDTLLSFGPEAVSRVRGVLWDVLLELQELSPSTASVMHLLAQLYSDPGCQGDRAKLTELVPRLWQFLRHTLRPVRAAVVACLQGILDAESGPAEWLSPLLPDALALVYQNLLLEEDPTVLGASGRLWQRLLECSPDAALVSHVPAERVAGWAQLAATPPGARLDSRLMVTLHGSGASQAEQPRGKRARLQAEKERAAYGGDRVSAPAAGDRSGSLLRTAAGGALGALGARWPQGPPHENPVSAAVGALLRSGSATGRQVAGVALQAWAEALRKGGGEAADQALAAALGEMLGAVQPILQGAQPTAPVLGSAEPYSEVAPYYKQLRQDLGAVMATPGATGSPVLAQLPPGWTAEAAPPEQVAQVAAALASGPGLPAALGPRSETIRSTAAAVQSLEALLHSAAQAALAGAVISSGPAFLPPKLNILVQPLMGALRREPDELLSARAASALASLVLACVGRKPSPNTKVVTNLCTMACADPKVTPVAGAAAADEDPDAEPRPEAPPPTDAAGNPLPPAPEAIARLGAEQALRSLAAQFGDGLLQGLPKLWELVSAPLAANEAGQEVDPQALVNSLQLLSIIGPSLTTMAWKQSVALIPALACCCGHARSAVRSAAAGAAAALATARTDEVMPVLLRLLTPMLSTTSDPPRRGSSQALSELVTALRGRLAAYTVLLLVPMLGRMADPLPGVRRAATAGFAHLVELLPLSQGLPAPEGLDDAQMATWKQDSCLLEQLLDNKKTADYALPPSVVLSVKLRTYQQEGINWLAFLRKFGLHGVLADDMGLGKTLQGISIMAAATVDSIQEHRDATGGDLGIPSVITCPPTLVGHWATEIERFLGADGALRPLCYEGTSSQRKGLQSHWESGRYNVIIMSYESCRADIEWLGPQRWLYAILDEGHIIKNAKTKVSQAVKRLISRHRLVLSGTPIQNDVLELWSIFDFLMPGFLGSEQKFNARFRRAVQVAKTSKKGSRELEQGMLAADSLHKAVMPFVLRRTKDQVLSDLPPKIIQDVYCNMSPLQVALYDHFSKSNAASEIRDGAVSANADKPNSASHVFASLQYLRKLCSHPELAIDPSIPQHRAALEQLCGTQDGVGWEKAVKDNSLLHAPKLGALRDILCQCQIGNFGGNDGGEDDGPGNGAGHRVLIFAQLRSLLDIVERDLLAPGGVSFLRLDGNVAGNKRFEVAQRFNADPTIDVLLLTTGVGGLGLNLTTADTVVFLEHDWNPQKDLQAMDRAHRLGQKRTVNVYRLLMRDTLEEKIMGMQRFKLDVANAVVNTDNVSLKNMDTAQLLDLFAPAGGSKGGKQGGSSASAGAEDAAAAAGVKPKGLKAMLAGLEELWDESQYAEEFSLDGFISKLGK